MDKQYIAFALNLKLGEFTGVSDGHLFVVECEFCHQRCGSVGVSFPLILAKDFPDCIWKLRLNRHAPTMSWNQFELIISRARNIFSDDKLELVPNSALGPISIEPIGRWPKELKDIDVADPGGLLMNVSLINSLARQGIELSYQKTILKDFKKKEYVYEIMQPVLLRILHPKTFEENPQLQQCYRCGEIKVLNYNAMPPRQIYLNSECRATIPPLFRVRGYESLVFVSDKMKSNLDELKPKGLEWSKYGVWV